MLHLKSYVGSIVLAGLLLQGCGGGSSESTPTTVTESATDIQTSATITALTNTINSFDGTEDNATITKKFNDLKVQLSAPKTSTSQTAALQTAGLLSSVTDSLKVSIEKLADTSVGNKITSATFDVVLNSEGVTVVMLDAARASHTMTKIMIDALDADWSLTKKMIPMLQTNSEFGEKFAALAYEEPDMARFFFSRVDAPMYNALADAMLLSNNDSIHDSSVSYSTNGYMGLLMNMYSPEYFVLANSGQNKITVTAADGEKVKYAQYDANGNLATDDNFVSLLFDTQATVTYDSNTTTFTGHGDGNELINEKFFYSLFKTPDTTNSFVDAMDQLDVSVQTELMDSIFLGQSPDINGTTDTMQGYLNIISIGSAMYDGIYGTKDANGVRQNAYGFGSYSGAFIGFAGLIPANRYMSYGKAFVNAGYQYASFHGINVWNGVSSAVKNAWNSYTTPATASGAPARSAGLGVVGSDWTGDVTDLLWSAYDNFKINISWADLYKAITDSDKSIMTEITNQLNGLKDSGNAAYHTLLDGRDDNNNTVYSTNISNGSNYNDDVYGFHGLIELAVQEDVYYVTCGNRSTRGILSGATVCSKDVNYTMDDAKAAFTLPPFSELTWSFAYGTAKNGAKAYMGTIDSAWFADLSSNELVRKYFYPSASNVYIPNWMLAIDWLTVPANYTGAGIADYDFQIDFNSGYLDVYVASTNANLLTDINLPQAVGSIKTISMIKVEMGSDSIIVVNENGTNTDGLYVYKITVVSPADAEAVLAYLGNLGSTALNAIGIDSSNAATVDTTAAN